MPITTETIVNVVCDNEKCPGNELDPHNLGSWIQIQTQVHPPPPDPEINPLVAPDGSPIPQMPPMPAMNNHVFCSAKCASAALRTYQIENPV